MLSRLKPTKLKDLGCIWNCMRQISDGSSLTNHTQNSAQPLQLWSGEKLKEEFDLLDPNLSAIIINFYNQILPYTHDHPFYKEVPRRLRVLMTKSIHFDHDQLNKSIINFIAHSPHKISADPLYDKDNHEIDEHLGLLSNRPDFSPHEIRNLHDDDEEQGQGKEVENESKDQDPSEKINRGGERIDFPTTGDLPDTSLGNPYYSRSLIRRNLKHFEKEFHQHAALYTMKFGHPLVVDCSYEKMMRGRELTSYINQLHQLHRDNIAAQSPYNVHFCNVTEDSVLHNPNRQMVFDSPPVSQLFLNSTSQCMTELFDKKDLIMLSPHAPYMMEKYEPEKIYIIGGWVDISSALNPNSYNSYKRATELGIVSYKLPLTAYVDWGSGTNIKLVLSYPLRMLHSLQEGNDWIYAIKNALPPNTLQRIEEAEELQAKKQALRDIARKDAYLRSFRSPAKVIEQGIQSAVDNEYREAPRTMKTNKITRTNDKLVKTRSSKARIKV